MRNEAKVIRKAPRHVTVSAGTVEGFVLRSLERAGKLDRGETLPAEITMTFEDPSDLVRVLSADEVEQMLASHHLYLETEYREGHRANFSSTNLTGRDFSGLNLRGIKMDRALLRRANFTGALPRALRPRLSTWF